MVVPGGREAAPEEVALEGLPLGRRVVRVLRVAGVEDEDVALGGTTRLKLLVSCGLVRLCVFRRVKDHFKLLFYSPLLKKTCVRQVALAKWFPLSRRA